MLGLSHSRVSCCSVFCSEGLGFKPELGYRIPQLRIFSFYRRIWNSAVAI